MKSQQVLEGTPAQTLGETVRKQLLRRLMRRRRTLFHRHMPEIGSMESVVELVERLAVSVVAGYWPIGSELDPRPLLKVLFEQGLRCALPVVTGRDRVLEFRAWMPGQGLLPDECSIPAPPEQAQMLYPELILVPLLAFNRKGQRLGQGLGLYDRTLAALRNSGRVTAVGLGYSIQEVEKLPCHEHDQTLDWIATEDDLIAAIPAGLGGIHRPASPPSGHAMTQSLIQP